jgi:hypothetical protein
MRSITSEYGTLLQNIPATQRKERLRAERCAVSGDKKREIVMVEVVSGLMGMELG